MDKPDLYIIAGPTASGKSDLAVALASAIGGEVISGDSMQVYRGMDIGTAKIRPEEMKGIPHHLIDVADPWEEWNVARFTEEARALIPQIIDRGHVPIVAGGTGFYLHALAYGASFRPEEEAGPLRAELQEKASTEAGRLEIWQELKAADPLSAEAIHPNNVKRVIRALEFYRQTGRPISEHNRELHRKESPYTLHYYILTMPRPVLYRRIEQRIDRMIAEGLVDEVRRLREAGCRRGMVSMQGLGYKEILDYLDGLCTLQEAVDVLKRDTRHFAKRQLTWFRREEAVWIERTEEQSAGDLVSRILA